MLTKNSNIKGLCAKFCKVLIEGKLVNYKKLMRNYGRVETDRDL